MNFVIPNQNLKVFGKAIQALSKIGDELYFEADENQLSLKAVNNTKTTFIIINFFENFFSSFSVTLSEDNEDDGNNVTCKINMKSILSISKHFGHKDKKVNYLKIEHKQNDRTIVFTIHYKHDVSVIHSLHVIDAESLSVVYRKDGLSNLISAHGQLFTQILTNFQLSDSDISFDVGKTKSIIRNYALGDVPSVKTTRSQIALNSSEFNSYKITNDTTITFSLKPFRTAISFAELSNLYVSMIFENAGEPAILLMNTPIFEANVVMATISPDGITQSTGTTIKSRKGTTARPDITVEDQQVLDDINWDNEFDTNSKEPEVNEEGFMELMNSVLNKSRHETTNNEKNSMDVDAGEEVIPGSPESPKSKRIKTVFGRCFENTFHPSTLDLGDVLVAESDPEMDDT